MRRFVWIPMLMALSWNTLAQGDIVKLPAPRMEGGMPLMQALKQRHSSREFAAAILPMQTLSDLLWAASGVNRPDGRRTAPTARNMREILVYVATADGAYLFDPDAHALKPVLNRDIRKLTGTQDFVGQAPVNLVYVADLGRMDAGEEDKRLYSATDTGFIAQNAYLYCASAGLATVVRGSVDRAALAAELRLSPNQRIILAQTIGYPK
jgi:nitroreductase